MSKTRTSNGKRGGLLKGKPHYDKDGNSLGGIKAVVTDAGGKPVELEGGEVIINKEASKKYWKELSKINQSAGNGVPILPPDGAVTDEDPEEFSEGGNIIEFNPNHLPNKWITEYAKQIKKDHPEIWKKGGNIFGNEAFVNLVRVRERGHWLDSEEWMYIKWRSYVARHKKDFRIEGVVAMLKWCDKIDKGWGYMKTLIEKEIANLEKKKKPSAFKQAIKEKSLFKDGGKVSKTNDSCQVLDKDGNPAIDDKSLRKMEKCIMKLTQTKDLHLNANGKYKLARRKLHKKIIDEFKKNAVCITKGQPIAILMGGSPASGKSSFLRKYRPFLLQEEILKVDADEIRAKLPEYKGYNATQTHQETKDIVTTLISDRNIGVPCDFDLIYDGTMNNVRSYKPLIELLRSRNYKIFIVYMDKVPKEVIMQRMKDRYLKTGRFVPAEVVDDFFKKGTSAFEELKPLVDGYLVIDGSNQDYDIIEKGGMQLPEDRAYSKLGQKISAEELEKIEYKRGGNLDKIDSVELDIPLLIRVLEFAREDIKSDPELHHVVERLIKIRDKGVLTMEDYDFIADLKKKEKFSEIERKYANGGAVLLAPNGKPSNLTPKQYKLVRTPEFKAWFGDWENDPENASKVVDSNGEPLVVYHGTPYGGFYEFDLNSVGKSTIPYWGKGIYTTASKFYAKGYAETKRTETQKIYDLFLKCINPYIVKRHLIGKDAYMKMVEENQYNDFNDFLDKNGFDSVIILDGDTMNDAIEIMTPLSNQIKLADGTNTTFDGNNPDIRFETGGNIEQKLKDLKGVPYNELLRNIQDSYKELGAEVGVKGHTKDGEPIIGYLPYQYDYMHTSDITNKKIRFFIDLGEGKLVHPSEVNPKFSVSEQKRLEQTADQFYRDGLENYNTSIENLKKNQELDLVKESLSKALNNGFEIENQYDGNDYFESNGSSILVNNKNGIRLNISKYIERINGEAPKTKLSNLDLLKFKKEYLDKFEKGGLLAPNGKPSKLTSEQYKLVRTPEFKAWFGDWENDPENASKVVDGNGEPLVVFHGTKDNRFTIFDKNKAGSSSPLKDKKGFFFTSLEGEAENYKSNYYHGGIFNMFLSIKNPYIYDKSKSDSYDSGIYWWDLKHKEFLLNSINNDGVIVYSTESNLFVAFDPNQIKLADGTNTTFDPNNDDIRFENGGEITNYTEFYDNLEIKDGSMYIGQKFSDVFPFLRRRKKPNDFRIMVNQYYGVLDRLRKDNYSSPTQKQRDLNKLWRKRDIEQKKYLSRFYLDGIGTIIEFRDSNYNDSNTDVKFETGGAVLLAPNGNPSNLTPEQHKLVRTPEFKAWFGDWENDPENASKVVDENGEPLVVFHGSSEKFHTFNFKESKGVYTSYSSFTPNKKLSESYGNIIYGVFLKIEKPSVIHGKGQYIWSVIDKKGSPDLFFDEYTPKSFDGIVFRDVIDFNGALGSKYVLDISDIYMVRKNTQIKLADGTNTTFDGNNPDIRFETGGIIDEDAQQYIDIVSMNPTLEKYQKYKDILKEKYNIDFDSIYKDNEYIETANLDDIKSQTDFLDFDNWLKYAKIISTMRGFVRMDDYSSAFKHDLTDDVWKELSEKLDFNVEKVEYIETSGNGDIARAMGDTIFYTDHADLYYLFHETAHIYDFQNQDKISNIVHSPAYSPTEYGTMNGGEAFAENFAIYFINPTALKKWNQEVYETMDKTINEKYKKELNRLVSEYIGNKNQFENGGKIQFTSTKSVSINVGDDLYKFQYQRGERGDTDKPVWFAKLVSINEKPAEGRLCFEPSYHAIIEGFSLKEVENLVFECLKENELWIMLEDEYGNEKEVIHVDVKYDPNTDNFFYKQGGLIAPNGKPSNLTTEQYKLVRTPEFKAWFGDWENDPENASKVVDENGEPKVVFHGSKSFEIQEFDLSKSKRKSSGLKEYGTYFTDNIKLAEAYKNWGILKEEEEQKIDAEINLLKEVLEKARNNRDFDSAEQKIKQLKEIKKGKIYSLFLNLKKMQSFDAKGEVNIEAWNNLEVKASYKWASNRDAMYFLKEGKFGVEKVDGIEAKNIVDAFVQTDELKKQLLSNVYLVFDSHNIKLADGTNTTFDGNNPDIRFENGGTVDLASFNKNSKTELKKGDYQHLQTRDEKRKAITFLYAMEYYAKNSIVPLAEPDNEESIYWQRVSINDKEYIVGFDLSFYDFNNPLKITEAIVTFYDENYNELDNPNTQYKQGGNLPNEKYLTLYHGTILKNLPKIEKNGLVSNLGYSAGWYMLSTDFESALYHANTINEGDKVPVIEFHIPITKTERWEGYPYVWTEEKRNDKSSWYAPMQEIPKEFIHKIHYVSYKNWLKQKAESFETGGRTTAQTPAPSKERIYGSEKNKPKSSKDSSSAESIKFDEKTLTSIENKLKEHNESHPDVKVNLATAKAVVRRGMGAYSKSHRPTISGGKPNSRVAWGLARLNAFLYKAVHGESKSGKYSQDNDLLDELSIAHDKFKTGGEIPKKNKNGNCYEKAGKMILYANTKYYPKIDYIGKPYLVHAQVTGQGAIEGVKYGHAWIEDDAFVYDYSNKRKLKVPKALYYEIGQIIEQQPIHFKYTFEQARRKMNEIGHYGSWDLITESGL